MNRTRTFALVVLIVVVLFVIFGFAPIASAQEKIDVYVEQGYQTVERIFDDTPSGKYSNQRYKPSVNVLTARVRPTEQVSALIRWDFGGTLDMLEVENFQTRRYESNGRDQISGKSTELELRGGYRIVPGLNVTAGYTRFGVKTTQAQTQFNWELDDEFVYRGLVVGAESGWSNQEIGFSTDFGWYPRLTRKDSYEQRVPDHDHFHGDSETNASGYQASARMHFQVWKGIQMNVSYRFRETRTPFGNHLFRVIPDQDPERTRWNTVSFGAGIRF